MWNRLGRDHFVGTKELRGSFDLHTRGWGVCEEYEIEEVPLSEQFRTTPEGSWEFLGPARIVNKYSLRRSDKWRFYDPINDTPELFLEFARLNEGDLLPSTILQWVQRYGLLGLNNDTRYTFGYFDPEYAEAINTQTKLVSAVLKGYEAVLNGSSDVAKQIIFNDFPHFFTLDWTVLGIARGDLEQEYLSEGREDTIELVDQHYDGDYLRYLLDCCTNTVEDMVRASCWLSLSVEQKSRSPVNVAAGWGIRNLLGAMYLQMYRLMAAGEEVTTCRYCGRIISLMPAGIGDRKTRQDKKYCDNACRQRYHYQNRVKLRCQKRQGT